MKQMNDVPRNCGILHEALALLFAFPALAYTDEELTKDARVSIAEARADGRTLDAGAERFAKKHGIKTLSIS